MTKEEQFVNELIGYIFAYPDDDYMTMECLCRKLVKHGLLDKVDGYYQMHEIRTNTHECVKDTHDKTEPTISKMEQVDKDINVRSKDEPQIQLTARCLNCNNAKACKEKHWEGCVYEPKDEKTCETCRHWKYIAHEWQCEACKCQGYEPKDEPQTDGNDYRL